MFSFNFSNLEKRLFVNILADDVRVLFRLMVRIVFAIVFLLPAEKKHTSVTSHCAVCSRASIRVQTPYSFCGRKNSSNNALILLCSFFLSFLF